MIDTDSGDELHYRHGHRAAEILRELRSANKKLVGKGVDGEPFPKMIGNVTAYVVDIGIFTQNLRRNQWLEFV